MTDTRAVQSDMNRSLWQSTLTGAYNAGVDLRNEATLQELFVRTFPGATELDWQNRPQLIFNDDGSPVAQSFNFGEGSKDVSGRGSEGIASALAWTNADPSFIAGETSLTPGSGRHILGSHLGDLLNTSGAQGGFDTTGRNVASLPHYGAIIPFNVDAVPPVETSPPVAASEYGDADQSQADQSQADQSQADQSQVDQTPSQEEQLQTLFNYIDSLSDEEFAEVMGYDDKANMFNAWSMIGGGYTPYWASERLDDRTKGETGWAFPDSGITHSTLGNIRWDLLPPLTNSVLTREMVLQTILDDLNRRMKANSAQQPTDDTQQPTDDTDSDTDVPWTGVIGGINDGSTNPNEYSDEELEQFGLTRDQAEYLWLNTDTEVSPEEAEEWMGEYRKDGTGTEDDPYKRRTVFDRVLSKPGQGWHNFPSTISQDEIDDFEAGKDLVFCDSNADDDPLVLPSEGSTTCSIVNKETHDIQYEDIPTQGSPQYINFIPNVTIYDHEKRGGGSSTAAPEGPDAPGGAAGDADSSASGTEGGEDGTGGEGTEGEGTEGDGDYGEPVESDDVIVDGIPIEIRNKLPEATGEEDTYSIGGEELKPGHVVIIERPRDMSPEGIKAFCENPEFSETCRKFEEETGKPYNGEWIRYQVPEKDIYTEEEIKERREQEKEIEEQLKEIARLQKEIEDLKARSEALRKAKEAKVIAEEDLAIYEQEQEEKRQEREQEAKERQERIEAARTRLRVMKRRSRIRWGLENAGRWFRLYKKKRKKSDDGTDGGGDPEGEGGPEGTDGTGGTGEEGEGEGEGGAGGTGGEGEGEGAGENEGEGTEGVGSGEEGEGEGAGGEGEGEGEGTEGEGEEGSGTGRGSGEGSGEGEGTGTGFGPRIPQQTSIIPGNFSLTAEETKTSDGITLYDWLTEFRTAEEAAKYAKARSAIVDRMIARIAASQRALNRNSEDAKKMTQFNVRGLG